MPTPQATRPVKLPRPPGVVGACLQNGCDFCDRPICADCRLLGRDSRVYTVNGDPFLGWLCCECPGCMSAFYQSRREFLYPLAKLCLDFPDQLFYVERSNGQMDPPGTWKFVGNGWYSNKERTQVHLWIQKAAAPGKAQRKCSTLARLQSWQPPIRATGSPPG